LFQAEDGIRDRNVTGVQTCALPILQGGEPEYIEPDATISIEGGSFSITINDYLSDSITFESFEVQSDDRDFKKKIEKYKQEYEEIGRASCRERGRVSEVTEL